jgi:hypothetical protein
MQENENENLSGQWAVSLGFYPGVLIGMRSYYNDDITSHVFYLPFFDIAVQIYK